LSIVNDFMWYLICRVTSDRINAVYIKFVELDISLISTFCYLRIQGWSFLLTKKMQYGYENKLKFIALPFHYSSFFLNFSISVPVVIVPLVIFFLGHVIFMVNSSFDFQLPFKKSKRDRFWLYADIFLTTKHNAQTFYPSLL